MAALSGLFVHHGIVDYRQDIGHRRAGQKFVMGHIGQCGIVQEDIDMRRKALPQSVRQGLGPRSRQRARCAGAHMQRTDRFIHRRQHIRDPDLDRRARKTVAAARTARRFHQPGAAQTHEKLFEIRQRDILTFGNVGKRDQRAFGLQRQIDKRGQVHIKGTKTVDVDKNKQKLEFSGWVRPEDVGKDNIIASERVADVALTYQLSGDIGKTRGGLVGRLLSVFWP